MKQVRAKTCWGTAACLAWSAGLGFGLPGVYGTAYFARHGKVWNLLGFPAYGKGPFETIGVLTSIGLLASFVIVCAAELVAGILLWERRRTGLWFSLALLPVEAIYWVGFALPFGPVLGAARTIAVLRAFRNERASGPVSRLSP